MCTTMIHEPPQLLDLELLAAFKSRFFGYGSFEAPLWFVGLEEGAGNTFDEISARLQVWNTRGQRALEDARGYTIGFGRTEYFVDPVQLSRTWAGLIRVQYATEGQFIPSTEMVRERQQHCWGRFDSKACLLELGPLPSPGMTQWHYDRWTGDPAYGRPAYRRAVFPQRIAKLRNLVTAHRPRVVVFYGRSYTRYWREIIGTVPTPHPVCTDVLYHENAATTFLVMRHPADRRMKQSCLSSVGRLISPILQARR